MKTQKLGELCDIVSGGTPSRTRMDFWQGGTIPWIKIGNIKDKYVYEADEFITAEGMNGSAAKMLRKGTILYTIFATLGEVGILNIDACTNQAIAGISIKDSTRVLTDYLYYYLKSRKRYVGDIGRGVAQNNINMSILKGFDVPLPDIQRQKEIAILLEQIERIIHIRKQELHLLDNLVKARFVEMFGDVIHNTKGWTAHIFSEITSSRLGKMLDAKQQTGENAFPYLANFNVQWFRFELDTLNQMDFDERERVEFELKEGDLLVCEGGEIGRCAVWHNDLQPCFFQKALHRVRCDRDVIHPDYLSWWFKYNCDHGGFTSIAGAKATIAHLSGVKLKKLQVVSPPLELQNQFSAFVAQVDKSKVAIQAALDEAQTLFDSLMQRYFG